MPILLICLLVLCSFHNAYAIETHTKLWTSGLFTGSLSQDKKVRYYLENDVRFIDDKYKFEQILIWLGLGYRVSPTLTLYAGDAPTVSRNLSGEYIHQNILWQQASWIAAQNNSYKLILRSRLEEIKRLHESSWHIVLRETLLIKIPFEQWKDHALIVSDTMFLNLKNTAWINNHSFISQNRAFVGIQTQVTKRTSYTIGYMNQYQFGNPNQMSNILVATFNVTTG